MTGPTVAIVTPWWNHHELLPTYQQALYRGGLRTGDEVIVVDNGSVPPIHLALADTVSPITAILRNDKNRGFSRACNRGYRAATADAVLFLNNDIRATADGWLDRIRAALKPGHLAGAALVDAPHTMVDGHTIPYLDGWCVAGLADDWARIEVAGGVWNEEFAEPAYWGDNELSLRARAAGIALDEIPGLGLDHIGNYSSRKLAVDGVSAANRARYELAARRLLKVAA